MTIEIIKDGDGVLCLDDYNNMKDARDYFMKKYNDLKTSNMAIEQKVLRNVMEDMQKEVEVFEGIHDKDDDFYSDYSNISYTMYINSIARLKEVLFRMNINKEESA